MFLSKKQKNKAPRVLADGKRGLAPKKDPSRAGKFLYLLIVLVFVGVTLYIIFFSQFLAITSISVQGTEKIYPESIKEEIVSSLSGKYLGFLPKNNLILIRGNKIEQILYSRFKLIEGVKAKKKFPDSLEVFIKEKNPLMIFRTGGQDFVIDNKGIAWKWSDFGLDPLSEGKLTILEDTSGRQVLDEKDALSLDYVDFILKSKEILQKNFDITINQIVTTPSIAAGDIILETIEEWKIYFNKDIGIEKEAEMLKLVLDNKIGRNKTADLEYIDLRTNNKVYYKFKNTNQKASN